MNQSLVLACMKNIDCMICSRFEYCVFHDPAVPMTNCYDFKVDMEKVKMNVLPEGFSTMLLSEGNQI